MATHSLMQPRYVKSTHKVPRLTVGGPEHPEVKETASQSYKQGALVYKDSNGTIAICTDSSGVLNSPIGGQAINAATGTTGANVFFFAILPTDIYIMNVYHATAASAVTVLTQEGDVFGVIVANDKWHVDIENAVEGAADANARVRCVGFPRISPVDGSNNTIGDIYGFMFVQFLDKSFATDFDPWARTLQYA